MFATRVRVLANIFHVVVSGFRRNVDENCALLGCYATSSSNNFFFTSLAGTHELIDHCGATACLPLLSYD